MHVEELGKNTILHLLLMLIVQNVEELVKSGTMKGHALIVTERGKCT